MNIMHGEGNSSCMMMSRHVSGQVVELKPELYRLDLQNTCAIVRMEKGQKSLGLVSF